MEFSLLLGGRKVNEAMRAGIARHAKLEQEVISCLLPHSFSFLLHPSYFTLHVPSSLVIVDTMSFFFFGLITVIRTFISSVGSWVIPQTSVRASYGSNLQYTYSSSRLSKNVFCGDRTQVLFYKFSLCL